MIINPKGANHLPEFPQLLDISPEVDEGVKWYAVFVKGTNMVFHDPIMALQSFGCCPTDAHSHPILLNIEDLDAIQIDEPQQELEIGCHLIVEIVIAVLLQTFASQIKCWMSRDITHPHSLGRKLLAAIIAHNPFRILGRNVMNVGINRIHIGMLVEGAGNSGEDIVAGEEIVAIKDANYIARSTTASTIETIVDSIVRTTLQLQAIAQSR